jgi:hypothetical protein
MFIMYGILKLKIRRKKMLTNFLFKYYKYYKYTVKLCSKRSSNKIFEIQNQFIHSEFNCMHNNFEISNILCVILILK